MVSLRVVTSFFVRDRATADLIEEHNARWTMLRIPASEAAMLLDMERDLRRRNAPPYEDRRS